MVCNSNELVKISEPKGVGITQDCRKLKIEKFHKACSSPMLLGTESERIRWKRHAESMDKVINLYRNSLVNLNERDHLYNMRINEECY